MRNINETKTYNHGTSGYGCVVSGYGRSAAVSRESAGAAIRELRESRDWSLADFASVTGVSIMGLSYLERGARKPHKGTVQKVENGLGLPPGTYSRLVVAADAAAELERLTAAPAAEPPPRTTGPIVVDTAHRHPHARGIRRGPAGRAQLGDRPTACGDIKRI